MSTKILVGLLALAALGVACDSGSDTTDQVKGAVEERVSTLTAAVADGIEGLPVPREAASPVVETSTARTFNLPSPVSVADAHTWFSAHLPEGRSFKGWSWCSKAQDSLGVTWLWQRVNDAVVGTLSVEVGRDDRTEQAYVLTVVRPDHNPQTCHAD